MRAERATVSLSVQVSRLSPGCTIFFDDAEREDEHEVLRRWENEGGIHYEMRGRHELYAIAVTPTSRGGTSGSRVDSNF